MYGVVNTANEEEFPNNSRVTKISRPETTASSDGCTVASGTQETVASRSNSDSNPAGFTSEWRDGLEERVVERSRQITNNIAASTPIPRSANETDRVTNRNEELRIQEEIDEEEERTIFFSSQSYL